MSSVTPIKPPRWVLSELRAGDSLESLARLYAPMGVDHPFEITRENGIPDSLGVGSCEWAKAIARMVLHEGDRSADSGPKGFRCAVVASQPNKCEPGQGFPCFADRQRIFLPEGGPRPAVGAAPKAAQAGGGLNLIGLAILAGGIALGSVPLGALGVATTLGLGPLGQIGK